MPCYQPFRGDSAQLLLFKIASCLEATGGGAGVTSFNGLTGAVTGVTSFNGRDGVVILTLGDVAAVGDGRYVLKAGDTMTGALAMPAGTAALPSNTFSGDLDTGIYHPAANTVGLTAGGALTLAVSTTGINLTTALAYQYNSVNVIRAQTALGNYFFGPSGNLTMTGADNNSIGLNAFISNTTGIRNFAVGTSALQNNTTGSNNSAFGYTALSSNNTGGVNTAVGTAALSNNTTGNNNVAIGKSALESNTTGGDSVAIGVQSLFDITTPATGRNTAVGYNTGRGITTGTSNTILGANVTGLAAALTGNIIIADGSGNQRINVDSAGLVGFGVAAPSFHLELVGTATTSQRKIGINGTQVLYLPDQAAGAFLGSIFFGDGGPSLSHAAGIEGSFNTGVGISALFSNTSGAKNTAVGYQSLFSNTTGILNTAIGVTALFTNTTGTDNTAIGYQVLFSNTSGTFNTAFGESALFSNTTGTLNNAIGYQSLFSNTTGTLNTAVGHQSLFSNTTSSSNAAMGYRALFDLTTPATGQNTAVGYNTGRGITTGNNNTIIGANVTGLAAALSNNIILSDGAGAIRIQVDSSGNTTLAGTAATADGTAALPAKTFSADLDTGFYRIGANSIGTSTNGVLRITTNTTDVILATAFRLAMASGANQRAGNAVLVGGTVTVANTSVTANTIVLLTRKTSGGTIGFAVTYTVIAATSFTLTSDNVLDTSTYSYLLIEVP